jgi:anti-anti-sigma regulatory factor
MTQCHDSYDLIEAPSSAVLDGVAVPLGSAQCHDSYASAEPVAAPADGARHDCRFVDSYREGVHLVRVFGRVDWVTAGQFRDVMGRATDAQVVIDLAEATTDSAGTGALIGVVVRARKRGQQLVIVAPDPLQYQVCAAVGLDIEGPLVRSEPEALQWLADHSVAGSTAK